jgi:CubicO group peptidase (beta-lactamase class C family)
MKKFINSRIVLVITILLFIATSSQSQVIQTNTRNNNVDYEKLAKIDRMINEYINKNWLTGAVTIIIKDNQLVQYKGYGYADVATKKPMKNDAIFRIMSQTKAITSIGIMILYEQGKLLLDQPFPIL